MSACKKKALSILVNTKCNLRCKYCYVGDKAEHDCVIGEDFVECTLRKFLNKNDYVMPCDRIRFFSDGEATLQFDFIKRIFSKAKEINPNLIFEIQTNGIFNNKVGNWLIENFDEIWISYDLLPAANDANRVTVNGQGSSSIIQNSIINMNKNPNKKAVIGIRATISDLNVKRMKEGIKHIVEDLHVDSIWVDPIFPTLDESKNIYNYMNYMQFAKEFVAAHRFVRKRYPGVFFESNLTTNFGCKTHYACRSCNPAPHLTPDGYISACEMVTFGKTAKNMDVFIIGKYDGKKIEMYPEKIKFLQERTTENMVGECPVCPVKDYCAGYCLGECQNEFGSIYKTKDVICPAIRYIWKKLGKEYEAMNCDFPFFHP